MESKRSLIRSIFVWTLAATTLSVSMSALADRAGDKKRAALTKVKRLVIAPAFFGTDTLMGEKPKKPRKLGEKPRPPKPKPALNEEQERQRKQYVDILTTLETRAQKRVPERAAKRTAFEIIEGEAVREAMKALELKPETLFLNWGRMQGNMFPLPDPQAVKRLAEKLGADAVALCVLDEPRRSNGRVFFTGLSLSYESPSVQARAGFYVTLADGSDVLHHYLDALHPLTRIGNRENFREYILTDWTEAQEQAIEAFFDEFTRYTPPSDTSRR